jgi:hypothetical protein
MRFQTRLAIAVAMSCALGSIHATSQTFSIDAHVISAGTSERSGSPCFRLQATMAEPVAGYSFSADYAISAGFRAAAQGAAHDDIFFSAFEDCTP